MSFNISNYMDGVPVKISEKYKPPPKVSIPQAVLNRLASSTDDHYESAQYSYSFQLEKQVVRKLAEWKKVRELERENRRERIRKNELQKCRDIEAKQKQLLTAVSYPSAEDFSSDDSDREDTKVDVAVPESIQQRAALPEPSNHHHHPHQNFDTILQPIVANSYASYSPSTVFNASKINYSDFENDTSSPFDNIELKTINDLDILAQVLNDTQKHSKQNGSEVAPDEPQVQSVVVSDSQLAVEQPPSVVNSPAVSVDVSELKRDDEAATTTTIDSNQHQNQTSNYYYTTNVIPSNYQMMVQQTHSLQLQPQHHQHPYHQQQQQHQHQQYMLNYANMNHHNMESVNVADVYFNYNNLPASNHAYLYRDYTAQQPETTVGLSSNTEYYPNGVLTNDYCDSRYGLHSVDVVAAAGNRLDAAEMIPKSKSKSVPDILKELKDEIRDSEIRRTRNHSQTIDDQAKRNSSDSAQSSLSPPPVPSSLSSPESTSFMKLSPSSQTLAKNISSMGFPLERVAKIAEMYGNDDKKIVEHLIVLSELLDLGFEESKISEALIQFDNNKDKALDFLIS